MTTKGRLSILAVLGLTILVAGTPTGSADPLPSVLCNVSINRSADGALPPFDVPAGGRLVTRAIADGEDECRLLRGDGTVYARALQDARSRPYLIEYFSAEGRIHLRANLDYGEHPDDQQSGSGGSGGSGCSSTANKPSNVSWAFSPIGWH